MSTTKETEPNQRNEMMDLNMLRRNFEDNTKGYVKIVITQGISKGVHTQKQKVVVMRNY